MRCKHKWPPHMPCLSKQLIDKSWRNKPSSMLASVLHPLLCHIDNGRGCIFVQKEENQQVLRVHLANTKVHPCAYKRQWKGWHEKYTGTSPEGMGSAAEAALLGRRHLVTHHAGEKGTNWNEPKEQQKRWWEGWLIKKKKTHHTGKVSCVWMS